MGHDNAFDALMARLRTGDEDASALVFRQFLGKLVTIMINGTTTVDDHFPKIPDEEIIAWQLRGDYPGMEVTFRKIPFGDSSR